MSNKYRVLDLFSGCGGMSLGFEQAGFDIAAGIDIWEDAIETFKKNHPESLGLTRDISNTNINLLKKEIGSIDVVIGGPPCQGFSISGKRDPRDPRNKLYESFVSVVDSFSPKVFVLENVPNLISMNNGSFKEKILKDFKKIGYSVEFKVLLASDYGVPQNRKRVFFVGIKGDEIFNFPEATHKLNKITTSDAISDLDENSVPDGAKYRCSPKTNYQKIMRSNSSGVFNHETTKHSCKTIDIISHVPNGGNYKNLPEKYKDTRKVNIAWTRYHSDKPSHTIDTGHRHHFHYLYNRVPTVRESARLQSFPDDFIFLGSKTSQLKQVGNAVPPFLAMVIALQIKNILQ
jgi:DNA (cytosine-5)-methyltransferase 1